MHTNAYTWVFIAKNTIVNDERWKCTMSDFRNMFDVSKNIDTIHMSPRLFGGPPSYTHQVDPRILVSSNSGREVTVGRTMGETIYANPTIVSITPGKVHVKSLGSFMSSDFGINALVNMVTQDPDKGLVDDIYNKMSGAKYFYDFASAWKEYGNMVNLLCRVMAILIGIGDQTVMGTSTKYKYYNYMNWQHTSDGETNHGGSVLDRVFGWMSEEKDKVFIDKNNYVHFYAGVSSDSSDSISTTTRESVIQSKLESIFTDEMKDIAFLAGDLGSSITNDVKESINEAFSAEGLDPGSGWADMLTKGIGYLSGAKMVFPQFIDDFQYGKDITVNCRFVSPYGDPESIMEYCFIPLAHVMAFSMPRQESRNTFKPPLLVRGFSKGYFNTEMGVVSSLRINRGGPDNMSWTADGLPTEIEVTFDITPMYSNLYLSTTSNPTNFMYNDGLIEYLCTICGADMAADSISTKINLFASLGLDTVKDIPSSIIQSIWRDGLGNIINNLRKLP